MATRRDQLQSYQFLLQRVVSALVYRKTDPAQSPFRRAGGAIFAGIMLSVLALAVTAVIGLFATGCGKTADWKQGNAIIREKETSALYVILPKAKENGAKQSQTLYEVANFASAALIAGTTEVFDIKQKSLRENSGVSMGPMVGIPGAPNSIPKPDALSSDDWTLCSIPGNDDRDKAVSKLFIGTSKSAGETLSKNRTIVASSDGENFLISQGHKFRVEDGEDEDILRYLNAPSTTQQVDKAFVEGLAEGEPVKVPDFGDDSKESAVTGEKVGTVFEQSDSGNTTYWVAMADGVAEISQVQAKLISAKLNRDIQKENVSSVKPLDDLIPGDDVVALNSVGKFAKPSTDKPLCAAFPASGKQTKILYNTKMPNISGVKSPSTSAEGAAYADQVVVAPGTGALVEGGSADNGNGLFLVTASGQIFGIDQAKPTEKNGAAAPADALTAFGFNGEPKPTPVHIPRQVLKLIPEGPQLSPTRAIETVTGS